MLQLKNNGSYGLRQKSVVLCVCVCVIFFEKCNSFLRRQISKQWESAGQQQGKRAFTLLFNEARRERRRENFRSRVRRLHTQSSNSLEASIRRGLYLTLAQFGSSKHGTVEASSATSQHLTYGN
jgi:hypothetical protein